ncbi:MAG TPA: phosphoribosyltransferase [Gammaproteobacteria bacterium]
MYKTQFLNRGTAGLELAKLLEPESATVVLGMPGNGMPVAVAAARYLNVPLRPLLVRKLGIPGHDNLSMGALAPYGVQWLDRELIDRLGLTKAAVQKVVEKETQELRRSEDVYANGKGYNLIAGNSAVIVDDGIPDNIHNISAAIEFVRERQPLRLLIAAPVISSSAETNLSAKCEGLIYLHKPDIYGVTDYWYEEQTGGSYRIQQIK